MSMSLNQKIDKVLDELQELKDALQDLENGKPFRYCEVNYIEMKIEEKLQLELSQQSIMYSILVEKGLLLNDILNGCNVSKKLCQNCSCHRCKTMLDSIERYELEYIIAQNILQASQMIISSLKLAQRKISNEEQPKL